ncbi:MAG TPA: ATP-grasp domain-containing protein [Vicinamibacterales bacterium]|jgi:D-alanine-D-alanine ligase
MKVAIVQNRSFDGVVTSFGQRCPEVYSAKTLLLTAEGLREGGHIVLTCEGDKHLLAELERFMPAGDRGEPGGIVFNMAYGIQGDCRYTHVPAMLELAGIPYTGSNPLGHALALDKVVTKTLLRAAGVPTPTDCVMRTGDDAWPNSLRFPLVVKPRHESTSFGLRLVHAPDELADAVEAVATKYQQDALVEEYIDGREVCVALLGNEEMEVLPLVEQDFGGRDVRIVTWEDKFHKSSVPAGKTCPAPLDEDLAARIRAIAVATFRACHCRDYARVDLRIDRHGNPFVLEINSMASLGRDGSYVIAAAAAGYTHAALVNRILDVAHARYFGTPAPRYGRTAEEADSERGEAIA